MIERKTTHVIDGLDKLLDQFRNKPRIVALLSSYLQQLQDLENAAWEVLETRGIDASFGVGLDSIGAVVGRPRLGLDDANYRIALRAQIRINRSSGTPEDLIAVTKLSLPAGFTFSLSEFPPACVSITVNEQITFLINVLLDNLLRTKAAGVALWLLYNPPAEDDPYQGLPIGGEPFLWADWSDPPAMQEDIDHGYSWDAWVFSLNPDAGGVTVHAL